jgi:hypothetical protein
MRLLVSAVLALGLGAGAAPLALAQATAPAGPAAPAISSSVSMDELQHCGAIYRFMSAMSNRGNDAKISAYFAERVRVTFTEIANRGGQKAVDDSVPIATKFMDDLVHKRTDANKMFADIKQCQSEIPGEPFPVPAAPVT